MDIFRFINDVYRGYRKGKRDVIHRVFYPPLPKRPIAKVTVTMCSLNEEEDIGLALTSLLNNTVVQQYPHMFEFILADNGSTDKTVEIAQRVLSCHEHRILDVPKGKLNSRQASTQEAKGKIVVATDSDTIYPRGYLDLSLRYFLDPEIVAVSTAKIHSTLREVHFTESYLVGLHNASNRMCGCGSMYYKNAWKAVGGFNLSINQQDNAEMLEEEEYHFYRKLAELGKVAMSPYPCVTSSRRYLHKFFDTDYSKAQQRGERF